MMLPKLKPFLTAALLVAAGMGGARAWGACIGDEWVAGEWICEEEDGRLLLNSGGDGDLGNLMLTGGAGFSTNVPDVNGGCGHSLLFPGVDAAEAAASTNNAYDPLAGAEKFTIMAWVRRDSAPGTNLSARIFSDADSVSPGANGVEFRFSGADGKLALRINGTEVGSTAATVPATNGVWHHVAVAWDGTRAATNYATRNAHFYVDGVQRGVGNVLQTVVAGNYAPAVVGNASAARQLGNVLAGNVDDVVILPGWAPEPPGNGNTNGAIRCFMDWNDDIFPPTITPSGNIERDAGSCLSPVALELATPLVWDNCGVSGVTNNAPAAFPVGLSTVTWTAWDEAGNTATAVQGVVVVPSHTADCDGDGLSDWDETMIHGSDYDDPDTDGDGLPDGWEVWNGLSPVDSSGDDGADGDPDDDGFSNSLEYDLGAPANNPAWNGAELAYRLTHATPVVTTNSRSVTTNWVGMRVDVEDSWDCVEGGNHGQQIVEMELEVPDLLECGYYVEVAIAGSVENVDAGYDEVSFEAASETEYFSSHDGIPDELGREWCDMVSEGAVKTNLVLANSTVTLRYDTIGYRWHSGAYAQIVSATTIAPYTVNIAGRDFMCVGDTTTMSATGADGGPYTWNVIGDALSVNPSSGLITAVTTGVATVTATDIGGCVGTKEVTVIGCSFIDEYPDYALDSNSDSDNHFLRRNGDHQGLDIYYEIIPSTAELDEVLITVYDGDANTICTTIAGERDAYGRFKAGENLHVIWTAPESLSTGATGLYRVQLRVRAGDALCETSIDDADSEVPGWQCPNDCLAVHDLVYQYCPILKLAEGEVSLPVAASFALTRSKMYTWEFSLLGQTWLTSIVADSPLFASDLETFDLPDYWLGFVDVNDRWTPPSWPPCVYHLDFFAANHLFLQYWMYFPTSYLPVGNSPDIWWHEGDWEMAQIAVCLLDAGYPREKKKWYEPLGATCSQHYYGQTLKWQATVGDNPPTSQNQDYVEKSFERPVLYIALKSHAVYFREGEFRTATGTPVGSQVQYETPGGLSTDRTGGYTTYSPPTQSLVYLKKRAIINDWWGKWGAVPPPDQVLPAGAGPASPRFRGSAEVSVDGMVIQSSPVRFHNSYLKTGQNISISED